MSILEKRQKEIKDLKENPDFVSITDDELSKQAEKELIEMTPDQVLNYGLPFLDEKLAGIFPGDLIIVGGATGTGKTSLARDIAFNVGLQNRKTLYYLLEDHFSNSKKIQQYFSINRLRFEEGKNKFPIKDFMTGAIDKDLLQSYFDKLKKHKTVHKGLTWRRGRIEARPDKILKDIRKATKENDLIIIDHLHYLSYEQQNRQIEIESFMRKLSTIVKETSTRIILLAHYRKLDGKKPTDESFKDAQAIPQNATTTIHLWRDREAMDVEPDETEDGTIIRAENKTEFYIQKSRMPFASGNIKVEYDTERGKYEGSVDWYQGGIPNENKLNLEI